MTREIRANNEQTDEKTQRQSFDLTKWLKGGSIDEVYTFLRSGTQATASNGQATAELRDVGRYVGDGCDDAVVSSDGVPDALLGDAFCTHTQRNVCGAAVEEGREARGGVCDDGHADDKS
jgi:hypothetical protein